MKRKKLLTLFGSICLVLVLVALLLPACAKPAPPVPTPAPPVPTPPAPAPPAPAPPAPAPPAPPKVAIVSTHAVGSMAYVFTAGIAEAVEKKTGIKTRIIPSGTDISKVMPLLSGEADFAVFTGGSGWFTSHGCGDFAVEQWGPQPLQMAWRGGDLYVGLYTRGDAGIKTFADVKGRKVAQVPGYPTVNNLIKGGLAYAGLTLDDVTVINFPSHSAAAKGLTQGAIDLYIYGTTGADPMETASSPHGIYWIPFDPSNEEAIKRFMEYAPWVGIGPMLRAAGMKPGDEPTVGTIYPYCYFSLEKVSEDVVYSYAKGIWEGYDLYKDKHATLPYWDHKAVVDTLGCHYPYHQGLVKLLKEKGVWTAELEKFQKYELSRQAARKELWKEFLNEAREKKIKIGSDEFKDGWWNKLIEAQLLL